MSYFDNNSSSSRLYLFFLRDRCINLLDFSLIDGALPLENTSVIAAHGDEVAGVRREQALRNLVEVVLVALVVALVTEVGVAVDSDCADLVSDGDDGLAFNFYDVHDFVFAVVLFSDRFEGLVRSETLIKPF